MQESEQQILDKFTKLMTSVYKVYNREPDTDITKIFFLTMLKLNLSLQDVEYCLRLICQNEKTFPTPAVLKSYISQLPRKETPKIEYWKPANKQMGTEAADLVAAILEGHLTRAQILAAMKDMNQRYPNVGWNEEHDVLASYYQNNPDNKTLAGGL